MSKSQTFQYKDYGKYFSLLTKTFSSMILMITVDTVSYYKKLNL